MFLLTLTVGGCALSSLAVAGPASVDGASSANDQIVLITPNWKPSVPTVEAPKTAELKAVLPIAEKPASAVAPVIAIQKTLQSAPTPPVPVVLPTAATVPAAVTSTAQPVVIKKQIAPEHVAAPVPVWHAPTGSTLHKTVAEWAAKEQYTVLWEAGDLDYPIVSPLSFRGNFEEAVTQIFKLYEKAERSFAVQGWRTQRLIKITERSQVDAKQVGKSL
jgi:type IV pili sensor histidine kinase/response regulator